MIYLVLFYEFFLIGLFAVGGGAATIPFLFDLSRKYNWFSVSELADMIAVAESTPGPIGVNMATFSGYQTAGIYGALVATAGLVLPSLIIIILVAKFMQKFACNIYLKNILSALRPAVIALIIFAFYQIAALSLTSLLSFLIFGLILFLIYYYPVGLVYDIILSAILGIIFQL